MSSADLTLVSLLIHIPVVTTWVGFALFDVFAVLAPGLRDDQRVRLVASTRWLTLGLLLVIMVTGIWQTIDNPFIRVESFALLERLREQTTYGKALFVKHIFVIATVGLSLAGRFYLAGRAREQVGGTLGAARAGGALRLLTLAAIANALACLGVLVATGRMAIELH